MTPLETAAAIIAALGIADVGGAKAMALAVLLPSLGVDPQLSADVAALVPQIKQRLLTGPVSTVPSAATVNLMETQSAAVKITGSVVIGSFGPGPAQAEATPFRFVTFPDGCVVNALAGGSVTFAAGESAMIQWTGGTAWKAWTPIGTNYVAKTGNQAMGGALTVAGVFYGLGAETMSGGWTRSAVLAGNFPGITFSSTAGGKYGALQYDGGEGFRLFVGAPTSDVPISSNYFTFGNNGSFRALGEIRGGGVMSVQGDNSYFGFLNAGGSRRGYIGCSEASGYLNLWNDVPNRGWSITGVAGGASWIPNTDGLQSLGGPSNRLNVVYAATGTINTSDARLKTAVRPLSAPEIAAAKALSAEVGAFKFLAAIAEKGEAGARLHIGLTVQRAIDIMEAEGLDPFAYGFICRDEWEASPEILDAGSPAVMSERGPEDDPETFEPVELIPAVPPKVIHPARVAGDCYAFRYDELTLFIVRGLEARLAALEAA